MAKPVDNDNKNPNNKKPFELNTTTAILLSNAVLLIFIIIANTTTFILLNGSMDKKIAAIAPDEEISALDAEAEGNQEGILLDLGDFILNLADTAHRRYLKVGIALELSKTDEEIEKENAPTPKASGGHGHGAAPAADPMAEITAEMERYKPAIRDAVISVLSNKTSDELSTPTGKELAKEEILEMVNGIFAGQREVMRVSFGQFIIQ